MRTERFGIVIILAALVVLGLLAGCSGDDDGDTTDGDTTDGDAADGDTADGDTADGDTADGDTADGDTIDGDSADGDTIDGDVVDGDAADGDVLDGDLVDGDTVDGDQIDGDAVDGDEDSDAITGPTLEFVILGDPDSEVVFGDAYASQTPTDFYIGIQQVDLMTSADDAAPVTVFNAGEDNYTEVDMQGSTSLTKVGLYSLTSGTYTHAKVLLAMAHFKVQAKIHPQNPLPAVDGPVSVLAALSDTTIDSTARDQDWVQYSFNLGGINFDKIATLPEFPDSATGELIKENGQAWLLLELSEHMTINPSISDSYVATVTMKTKGCFRWEDQATAGYVTDVFDSDHNGNSEPVMSFGPGDYSIVIE